MQIKYLLTVTMYDLNADNKSKDCQAELKKLLDYVLL